MNNCSYFLSLLSTLLLLSPGCGLPPPTGNAVYTERSSDGELLLTVHVHEVDGSTLARQIGDLAGVKVLLDPINERVSVCAEKVPWRFALDLVAKEMFCTIVEIKSDVFHVAEHGCNMPPAFESADIKIVLELFARQLGRKLQVPSKIHGDVTGVYYFSSREDVRKAFDALTAAHGLCLQWPDPCSDSPIIVSVK